MNAKTVAEKVAGLRARRRADGLKRVEVWVHPDDAQAVQTYAKRKSKARIKAGDFTMRAVYEVMAE